MEPETWELAVVAVDLAGNRSEPSPSVSVELVPWADLLRRVFDVAHRDDLRRCVR